MRLEMAGGTGWRLAITIHFTWLAKRREPVRKAKMNCCPELTSARRNVARREEFIESTSNPVKGKSALLATEFPQ